MHNDNTEYNYNDNTQQAERVNFLKIVKFEN